MAGKGDIEAGRAFVTAYIKNSPLLKGLGQIKKELQGLGTSVMKVGGMIGAVGTAITAPIGVAVNQFVAMGTELQNISRRTGVGVAALAEFKHAAEQTGASLGDIEGASKSATKAIADAAMGGQGAAVALSRLGLTAEGLKQQLPEQQLQTIADRLNGIKDPAQQAALATQLLGGTNLLPMIGQLGALRKEARDLGLAPSEKAVADAANLGRQIKRGLSVVTATIFEIGSAVAPVLFPIGEAFIRITSSVAKWARENGEVVRTIFKIGSIVAAVGAAITAVGATIFGVGTVVGMVSAAITGIVSVIGSIISIASAVGAILSPILVPLGLIVVAVGGLTALLLRNQAVWNAVSTTAKNTLAGIVAAIAPYVDIVKTTIGGIVDALMSGQIGKAGEIAMTALRLAFEMARTAIVGGWLDLRNRVLGVWDSIMTAAAGALAFVGSLFNSVFTAITGFDFGAILSAGWAAFQVAAVAALDYVMAYVRALVAAMNAVRTAIWGTVQDVAIAVPAVAKATAAMGINQARQAAPDAMGALDKALLAGAEAMKRVGDDRVRMRNDREADANLWREAQAEVVAELREQLNNQAAEAKAARAAVRVAGAGDIPAGAVPRGGDIAAGAAIRASTGTFSGMALLGMGNDGGIAKKHLQVAEKQLAMQDKEVGAITFLAGAVDRLKLVMGGNR